VIEGDGDRFLVVRVPKAVELTDPEETQVALDAAIVEKVSVFSSFDSLPYPFVAVRGTEIRRRQTQAFVRLPSDLSTAAWIFVRASETVARSASDGATIPYRTRL
jgi:hypothetical protein